MIKRVMWWGVGALMGATGSQWAQRRLRKRIDRAVERYAPPAVADRIRAGTKTRTLTVIDGVRDAIDTGKAAAESREHELRAKLGTADRRRA
jgi:hypothetical protein